MENLLEELNKLAKEHNKEITPKTIEYIISFLNFSDSIYKIANELKNDPNSLFNNYTVEDEDILLDNQKNYLKSLKILNNIHNDKESIEYIKYKTFIYDTISTIFLKAGFTKGLSHFYSLSITKDLLVEVTSEITSELTINTLASYTDSELDSLKIKNKLLFSLIELGTNKKFTSSRVDKFIESIELSKQLKSLNNNTTTKTDHSDFTGTTSKNNKFETLKSSLFDNGFFELSKVKSLSHDDQSKLIDLLVLNDTPYNIAMFEYVGFFRHLESEKKLTKTDIFKKLAAFFECSKDCIKGNYYALDEHSKYDKSRYTSHLHKEKVKTDYYSLK